MLTIQKHLSVALSLACLFHVVDGSATSSFVASISPLGVDNTVMGTAVVFAEGSKLAFAGLLSGAPANLDATMCDATNGCGVHVHAGTSCTNTTTQEGHYYNADTLDVDPWLDVRYSSDGEGGSSFSGILDVGETASLEGRAFLVHAEDGSRIGCGLLTAVTTTPLISHLAPLDATNANVQGHITAVPLPEAVCFYGIASGLEPSITSVLTDATSTDCVATNGCGVHVHSGTACTPADAQGGHYYDTSDALDPWLLVGYPSTDAIGSAEYVHCVATPNATDYVDRPFIVHANDGSRVSCGLLEMEAEKEEEGHGTHDHGDEESSSSGTRISILLVGTMMLLTAASI